MRRKTEEESYNPKLQEAFELYSKVYKLLPKFYTFNYWKGHVEWETSIEFAVNLSYAYKIKFDEEKVKGKTHYYFNAYFVPTEAKETTFFEFLQYFSTLAGNNEEEENSFLTKELKREKKRCTTDRIYISVPDLYLNELMKQKGNFLIIKGYKVRAFHFQRAVGNVRLYSKGDGKLSAPSIAFYTFSKPVKPQPLLYLISALHFYNGLINGKKNYKIELLYPLVSWRFYEMTLNTIVPRESIAQASVLIAKQKPEGYEEIIKILEDPNNPFIEEMFKHAYNEETKAKIEELQSLLSKKVNNQ